MAIKRNRLNDGILISSHITDTYKIVKDGRRVIIRRLKEEFAAKSTYINAFKEEVRKGQEQDHKHILKYGDMFQDEKGSAVYMESVNCITLEDFFNNNPSYVTNTKEIEHIIDEVIEALSYLHTCGGYHLNLHPRNVLLTKDNHTVKLINPIDSYLSCTPCAFTEEDEYLAPELLGTTTEVDLMKSEIYSLGKFISYLFDMATIPYRYQAAIKKACNENPKKRPASISELQKEISASRVKLTIFKGACWSIITALVCLFIFWFTSTSPEDEIHFIKPTATDHYFYDSISGLGFYVSDSSVMVNKEALSQEEFKKQREYELKVQSIFKKEFKKKAEPIISNIYSLKNISGQAKDFSAVSGKALSELQKIENELSEQYGLDPISTAKMAAEVIDELSSQKMEELKTPENSKIENNLK